MSRCIAALLALALLALPAAARAATWTEGVQYARITPAQQTTVPAGKVEVLEVFSYGCPACNASQPVMDKLRHALPANAQLAFLPAAFNPSEDWPMFQRAYFAAQALGIAERTHQAMYDAVWKSGELAVSDPVSHRLKNPQPTLEAAARWYARVAGIKPEAFLTAAKSFSVEMKMKAADTQVAAMQVPGTPCLVVNGKYRLLLDSLNKAEEVIDLVNFLVAKEGSQRR